MDLAQREFRVAMGKVVQAYAVLYQMMNSCQSPRLESTGTARGLSSLRVTSSVFSIKICHLMFS